MLAHIWMVNVNNYETSLIIQDLNEFYSIIFIDELTKENSDKKIDYFEKKMENYTIINPNKIFINIGKDDFEGLTKIKTNNGIKYIKAQKSILLDYITEIFNSDAEEAIKNIPLKYGANIDKFITKNNTPNSTNKEIYDLSKNLDIELFKKSKKNTEIYSFLFENNFAEKIFNLLDRLKDYNYEDIEKIYDLMSFLHSEENSLRNIIPILPLITYKKKNAYFASYYYYFVASLLNIYKSYIPEKKEGGWTIFNYHNGIEGEPFSKHGLQVELREMNAKRK